MTSDRSAAMNELRLEPAETTYQRLDGNREMRVVVPFLDFVIDGTSLRELARTAGHGNDFVTPLCRAWDATAVAAAVKDLLGEHASAEVEMLVCSVCGDRGCGALLADVTVAGHTVTWHTWRFAALVESWAVDGLASYTFDRAAYEAEVRAAPARVARLPYDEQADASRRFLWPWQWGWRLPRER